MLLDASGAVLWTGDSGETRGDIIVSEYQGPRWMGDDAIRVVALCNDRIRTKGEATLVRDGKGWRWRSDLRCKV